MAEGFNCRLAAEALLDLRDRQRLANDLDQQVREAERELRRLQSNYYSPAMRPRTRIMENHGAGLPTDNRPDLEYEGPNFQPNFSSPAVHPCTHIMENCGVGLPRDNRPDLEYEGPNFQPNYMYSSQAVRPRGASTWEVTGALLPLGIFVGTLL